MNTETASTGMSFHVPQVWSKLRVVYQMNNGNVRTLGFGEPGNSSVTFYLTEEQALALARDLYEAVVKGPTEG